MIFNSIRFRLIGLGVIGVILTTGSALIIAEMGLRDIVSTNQQKLFTNKLQTVLAQLQRMDTELQKTGVPEAYQAEFERLALVRLSYTHQASETVSDHPIIVDNDGTILLGDQSSSPLKDQQITLPDSSYEGFIVGETSAYWYIVQKFKPWDWQIVYAVPMSRRLESLREFRVYFLSWAGIIGLCIGGLIAWIIARIASPIHRLTLATQAMACGESKIDLPPVSKNEIGILSASFADMRTAVRGQLQVLKMEIKQREEVEAALRSSEEELSSTLNSLGNGVLATDASGIIRRINPAACELLNCTKESIIGQPLGHNYRIVDGENKDLLNILTGTVLGKGLSIRRERHVQLAAAGHADIPIALSATPIHAKDRSILGMVVIFNDISQRIELEERLHQSQKMDAVGQLAGGIAHDFNNMLAGIIGSAEMLTLRSPKNEISKKYIGNILKTSERAASLVRSLMSFSRQTKACNEDVVVNDLILQTHEILSHTLDRTIHIEYNLDQSLPAIRGDSNSLQSALLNLGINARDAMPNGGNLTFSTSVIELDADYCHQSPFDVHPGSYVHISIEDTGMGIPHNIIDRIFEPFFTTKELGKGTGLGLAAVYGTISQHDGAISVYSEPNKGTVFHLYLPLRSAFADDSSVQIPNTDYYRKPLIAGKGMVLIVDDEAIVNSTLSDRVSELGYQVINAHDGSEGIQLFHKHHNEISLVLLDLVMPQVSGKECFLAMQKIDSMVPIILMSGFSRDIQIDELINGQPCRYFLQKPITNKQLYVAIASVLNVAPSNES